VVPHEDVGPDLPGADRVGELVPVARVAEEEERVERHVELPELRAGAEHGVVLGDPLGGPHQVHSRGSLQSVGLNQQ
jgi:hypothetical protein